MTKCIEIRNVRYALTKQMFEEGKCYNGARPEIAAVYNIRESDTLYDQISDSQIVHAISRARLMLHTTDPTYLADGHGYRVEINTYDSEDVLVRCDAVIADLCFLDASDDNMKKADYAYSVHRLPRKPDGSAQYTLTPKYKAIMDAANETQFIREGSGCHVDVHYLPEFDSVHFVFLCSGHTVRTYTGVPHVFCGSFYKPTSVQEMRKAIEEAISLGKD